MNTPRLPLQAKGFMTPKGCIIRRIELHGNGTAEVGYDCGGEGGGGRGKFPRIDGGFGTYPVIHVKNAHSVHVPGTTITGTAKLGFTVMPRHMKCGKSTGDPTIRCQIVDEKGKTLEGAKRRRRKRSR